MMLTGYNYIDFIIFKRDEYTTKTKDMFVYVTGEKWYNLYNKTGIIPNLCFSIENSFVF